MGVLAARSVRVRGSTHQGHHRRRLSLEDITSLPAMPVSGLADADGQHRWRDGCPSSSLPPPPLHMGHDRACNPFACCPSTDTHVYESRSVRPPTRRSKALTSMDANANEPTPLPLDSVDHPRVPERVVSVRGFRVVGRYVATPLTRVPGSQGLAPRQTSCRDDLL